MEEAVLAEMKQIQTDLAQARQKLAAETDPNSLNAMELQDRIDTLTGQYRMILNSAMTATKPAAGAGVDTVTIPGVGAFTVNKTTGDWTPGPTAVPPNLDEQQLKAVENQMAGAKRDEIERNRAAGNGGLTDQQVAELARLKQDSNTSAGTLQLARDKWEKNNAAELAQIQAGTKKTTAETGLIASQTNLADAQIQALGIKTDADADESYARGDLTRAQADAVKQKLKQPTITDLGTGATYGVMTPGGTIEERYRQGYVPKTRAEIAARAGQVHSLIQQKGAELQAKIDSKEITGDQALQQYNAWAAQNVQPQQQAIAAAQEEADFARAKEEADQRRQAMTGALAAGNQARDAFTAAAPYRVGENYGQGFEKMLNASLKGSGHGDIDMTGSATWKGPDMMSQSPQQATMEALKYLSPTAAQATGSPQPNYQGVDLSSSFAPFQFGTTPPAPAAAPGASPSPGAAPVGPQTGPFGTDQQQINRRLTSFQTEAATNQQPNAFQGINSQGMAGLMARQAAAAAAASPMPEMGPARPGTPMPYYRPAAGPPQPEPMPWGPQATGAMNIGGWGDETPWATQASNAMNVGGWNSPMPDYPYGPPNLPSNTTYTPPPELAPTGVQGLNVQGMNVQGMNLGGQFSGVPWADLFNRYRYGGGGGGNAGFTP